MSYRKKVDRTVPPDHSVRTRTSVRAEARNVLAFFTGQFNGPRTPRTYWPTPCLSCGDVSTSRSTTPKRASGCSVAPRCSRTPTRERAQISVLRPTSTRLAEGHQRTTSTQRSTSEPALGRLDPLDAEVVRLVRWDGFDPADAPRSSAGDQARSEVAVTGALSSSACGRRSRAATAPRVGARSSNEPRQCEPRTLWLRIA